MSCAISIGGDCDGHAAFSNLQMAKARKVYKCCECGDSIAPGERYERFTANFDGEFCSYKTCIACADIRESFSDVAIYGGGLWEEMHEQWPDVTTACFDQLTTVEGKRKLRAEWMKWKGLAA